ncbi:hypothetical protein [Clostridium sp. DJ247]|uniref:hypothetical protein n=1 Tax=Clostridium sp. DJ247 TaxID=2726188 RepID=UPI00162A64E0|nr:hypothetical protein [Clostridium sp. DJ247]MBC2579675.1 hypothetical protein [Clostridium sp. DJ247]
MKLILRKNDSSTSLLLFIYNIYMTKTTKDYIKLSSLIEIMKVFGKNETATRMALSRATKAGLLTNSKKDNEVNYALTLDGRKFNLLWDEGVMNFWKRYQFRNSKSDSKWYLINVEFKGNNKDSKVEVIDKLQQYGFAQINTNSWLSPYHQYEEVWKLVEKYNLVEEVVETYGEMKIHKDMDKFLDDVYGIKKLKSLYQHFIDTYSSKLVEVKQIYKEQNFVSNGLALPILHKLGWSFFNIASDDAVLPKQILPEWEGDKAALVMRELREILLEAVYKYLEKFD